MNADPVDSPTREARFNLRREVTTALFCAVLAFAIVQLVGLFAGMEFHIATVAAIHFALATATISGFATAMYAMDDKDDTKQPSQRAPSQRPPLTTWRAA